MHRLRRGLCFNPRSIRHEPRRIIAAEQPTGGTTPAYRGQLAICYSQRKDYEQNDLRQVGLIGLIKASRLYEALTNVPFEVYVKPHIRGVVLNFLRDGVALVRLPRGVEEEGLRLSRHRNEDLDP